MYDLPTTHEEVIAWKLSLNIGKRSVYRQLCEAVDPSRIWSVRKLIHDWIALVMNKWPEQVRLVETADSFKVICFDINIGTFDSDDVIRMLCKYNSIDLKTVF